MNNYHCITEGKFNYYTNVKAKNAKKARKKAIKELTKKAKAGKIGMQTERIGTAKLSDNLFISDFIKDSDDEKTDYVIHIQGDFQFGHFVKAKSAKKASNKFTDVLSEICEKYKIGVHTDHVKVVEIEDAEI